jgi:hypothetical protein
MEHRHLSGSRWTLAAVDDVIARGGLKDWKELRRAAVDEADVRERILRVCAGRLAEPTEQRYYFWDYYVRRHLG